MSENIRERIYKLSRKTGIPVKKITDFLFILRDGRAKKNYYLIRKLALSRNAFQEIKKGLGFLLKPVSSFVQLRPQAKTRLANFFSSDYQTKDTLWSFLENENYRRILFSLKEFALQRPSPERKYDQFAATLETVSRRASLLSFLGDLDGKRLLFLGDHDGTSLAVGMWGGENLTVLDIDERVLLVVKAFSRRHKLRIKTVSYDACQKVPSFLSGHFDVVFTDPPYTEEGIKLFVSRAIELLDKNNRGARLYLCYGNSDLAKERYLPIYQILGEAGLMVRWVFDSFNRYQGAESIGSASSLIIAEVTPQTKPLFHGNCQKPIYTYQKQG